MLTDALHAALRYIPWWAVPSFVISFQFANIYFAKERRRAAWFFTCACAVSVLSLAWYIYAGSPTRSVLLFRRMVGGT